MGKTLAWLALGVVVLIVIGMVVISLIGTILKLAFYLVIGGAVVGGGYFLFTRARAALLRRS